MTMSRVRVFMFPPEVLDEVLLRPLFAEGQGAWMHFSGEFFCVIGATLPRQ